MTVITQAHLNALENALTSGVKSVTYNGETVVYRDMDELRTAITAAKRALSENSGVSRAPRQVRFSTSKGVF